MDEVKVLDHGFVRLRNLAGPTRRPCRSTSSFEADDTDVANAARLSFEGQDQHRTYDTEMKLTRYLLKNKHMTPFESIVVWLEFKAPIFVSRQLVRQRTQAINEASGRYITLPAEWYIPEVVGGKAATRKQGQEDNLDEATQRKFKEALSQCCEIAYSRYGHFIAEGVAPEHARLFLHVNHYTHWMTTMNLRNLFQSFLALRDHPHAQIESQLYARATIFLLTPHIPGLMALYQGLVREPR
jgi:thymidylate synthase (FAD)